MQKYRLQMVLEELVFDPEKSGTLENPFPEWSRVGFPQRRTTEVVATVEPCSITAVAVELERAAVAMIKHQVRNVEREEARRDQAHLPPPAD